MSSKKCLFIILSFLAVLSYEGFAQDSLSLLVEKAFNEQNPNKSLQILSQIPNVEDLADTLLNKYYLIKGVAYGQLGKADSSMFFLEKSIHNASVTDHDYILMKAYNSKGVLLRIQGEHEGSLEAFQNAEKIAEKHTNELFSKAKSDILGNIGGIFYQLKDYNSARSYSSKGLEIAKQYNDTSGIAYGYLRLAIVAQAQDSLSESLSYNEQANHFLKTLGDFNTLVYVQSNLGNIYKDQMDFESALTHHKKANEYANTLGDEDAKAHTLLSIAESYFQLGQLNEAYRYARKGLEIAENRSFPIHSKNAHDLLFRIAEKRGNYRLALEEKKKTVAIYDSLNAADAQERLAEVETKYETAKKEAEIDRLELDNEVKKLQLSKASNQLIGLSVIAILLIGGGVIFVTLRNKQVAAERIAQEHQLDAVKQRLLELQMENPTIDLNYDLDELNGKLYTPLTEREHTTLSLSLTGKSNSEMAEELFVSVNTVKFHLRNIYQKLGVANKKEAKAYIIQSS